MKMYLRFTCLGYPRLKVFGPTWNPYIETCFYSSFLLLYTTRKLKTNQICRQYEN